MKTMIAILTVLGLFSVGVKKMEIQAHHANCHDQEADQCVENCDNASCQHNHKAHFDGHCR